jgi:hypothetical protein
MCKTYKRESAWALMGVLLVLTARMFIIPPDVAIINALAPYYASFGGMVGLIFLGAFGMDAYAKQVQKNNAGS